MTTETITDPSNPTDHRVAETLSWLLAVWVVVLALGSALNLAVLQLPVEREFMSLGIIPPLAMQWLPWPWSAWVFLLSAAFAVAYRAWAGAQWRTWIVLIVMATVIRWLEECCVMGCFHAVVDKIR